MEQLGDVEAWKMRVGYGQRWMAETVFSVYKCLFDGHSLAKNLENVIR